MVASAVETEALTFQLPLIFMTGHVSEIAQSRIVEQNKSLEELNAEAFQKPYSVEGLGRKVCEVLDANQ